MAKINLTIEEAFKKSVDHMIAQGEPASDANGDRCLYRGPNGLKCAVGALIPDELYKDSMEGSNVGSMTVGKLFVDYTNEEGYTSISDKIFDSPLISVLEALQSVHDYDVNMDVSGVFNEGKVTDLFFTLIEERLKDRSHKVPYVDELISWLHTRKQEGLGHV